MIEVLEMKRSLCRLMLRACEKSFGKLKNHRSKETARHGAGPRCRNWKWRIYLAGFRYLSFSLSHDQSIPRVTMSR